MADFSSIDPTTLAQSLASYDIMSIQNQLKTKTATMTSQKKALDALRTALTDFRSAIKGLNSTNDGMLQNSATVNREGIATVTANSSAQKGTYNIEVDQLASAHQIGFGDLTDDAIKDATGMMEITLGEGADAKTINVDMDSINSLSDLTKAINGDENNPGVTASLIRTDGKVTLMLSSDESGAANKVTVGGTAGFNSANAKEISKAQDAKFRMGEMEFSNSSNTLDKLIDGVTIELTSKTEADKPLTITIGTDTAAPKSSCRPSLPHTTPCRTRCKN